MANYNWTDAGALINQYSAQELYTGYSKVEVLPSFLTDMLINRPQKNHREDKFSFDIKSEGATVPTYCTPRSGTNLIKIGGYTTVTSGTPYINEGFEITMDELSERPEGVNAYEWNKVSIQARLAYFIERKSEVMKRRLGNLWEVQLAQQIQTGLIDVSGKDVDMQISIRMPSSNKITLTGNARWNQSASKGTRLAQIQTTVDTIRDNKGGRATQMLMSRQAYANLLDDPQFLDRMNLRHTPVGDWNPRKIDNSDRITRAGQLVLDMGTVLDLIVYDAQYKNAAGQDVDYITDNNYILINPNMPFRKHYGRINNLKAGMDGMAESDMYTYFVMDPSGKSARQVFETAPVVACEDASGIAVVTTV